MCVDFTDLNKVCLKHSFPSAIINPLLDSIFSFFMFSSPYAYLGYNQIWVKPEDKRILLLLLGNVYVTIK